MSSDAPRASYLRRVDELKSDAATVDEGDALICARWSTMLPSYIADVLERAARTPPLHAHEPLLAQEARGARTLILRVAQYNMNVLLGADFKPPHFPVDDAAALLLSLNADVLFLQEASVQTFPPKPAGAAADQFDSAGDQTARILALHAALRAAGYAIHVADADSVYNPALVATRLPVRDAGEPFNVDVGEFREHLLAAAASRVPELRGARVVRVSLGADARAPTLACVATHLHHEESGKRGVRAAEVREIIRHLGGECASGGGGCGGGGGGDDSEVVILATDCNAVRRRDYNAKEWAVIARGKEKIGEPVCPHAADCGCAPASDGVEEAFVGGGFEATFDDTADGRAVEFTHWTSTCVDFAWWKRPRLGHAAGGAVAAVWRVRGVWPVWSAMSDHIPLVHEWEVQLPAPEK